LIFGNPHNREIIIPFCKWIFTE